MKLLGFYWVSTCIIYPAEVAYCVVFIWAEPFIDTKLDCWEEDSSMMSQYNNIIWIKCTHFGWVINEIYEQWLVVGSVGIILIIGVPIIHANHDLSIIVRHTRRRVPFEMIDIYAMMSELCFEFLTIYSVCYKMLYFSSSDHRNLSYLLFNVYDR